MSDKFTADATTYTRLRNHLDRLKIDEHKIETIAAAISGVGYGIGLAKNDWENIIVAGLAMEIDDTRQEMEAIAARWRPAE